MEMFLDISKSLIDPKWIFIRNHQKY